MMTWLLALWIATPLPPAPAQYVTDRVGVLAAPAESALNTKLAEFDRETSTQILVYIDETLPPGITLEAMSTAALRQWRVGQAKRNNGVIVFVFTRDHLMRIEAGYGLQRVITNDEAKRITSTIMKPRLRAGDYGGAVDAATNELMALSRREFNGPPPEPKHSDAPLIAGLIGAGVVLIAFLAWMVQRFTTTERPPFAQPAPRPADASGGIHLYEPLDYTPQDVAAPHFDAGAPTGGGGGDFGSFTGGGGDGGGGGASDSW